MNEIIFCWSTESCQSCPLPHLQTFGLVSIEEQIIWFPRGPVTIFDDFSGYNWQYIMGMGHQLGANKDCISGCGAFSFNSQSVSLLQAYLLLELSSSSLLAGTGGNWRRPPATVPLVFSVERLPSPIFSSHFLLLMVWL